MSSRGEFIGQGPSSGLYEVGNVPSDPSDIPTFINDELLKVSGHLGNSKAGEVFPVMSELPPRFKEGMTVFFTKKQSDPHINSAGVYIYKTGMDGDGNKTGEPRWWKMIDDPSETNGTRMIFKLTVDGTPPQKPSTSTGVVIPPGWYETPPDKTDTTDYIWVCVNLAYDPDTTVTEWSDPVIWSAGVKDGESGAGWWKITDDTWDGTWPSDASERFKSVTHRYPIDSDLLTFTRTDGAHQPMTKIYHTKEAGHLADDWYTPDNFIDGDLIATGTIAGDKIVAGTSISAPNIIGGTISGNTITGGVISGTTITSPHFTGATGDFTGDITANRLVARQTVEIGNGTGASSMNISNNQITIKDENGRVRVLIGYLG